MAMTPRKSDQRCSSSRCGSLDCVSATITVARAFGVIGADRDGHALLGVFCTDLLLNVIGKLRRRGQLRVGRSGRLTDIGIAASLRSCHQIVQIISSTCWTGQILPPVLPPQMAGLACPHMSMPDHELKGQPLLTAPGSSARAGRRTVTNMEITRATAVQWCMKFQVRRQIIRIEYATVEADSHAQAADLLRAGMWGDVVSPIRDKETVQYEINGLPVCD